MGAPKGNKYWEFRNKHGRDFKYTPELLWDEAVEYFNWIEENPLKEQKLFAFQGNVTKKNATKMRAMTITGFCLFADITFQTFENYKANEDFFDIVTRIEKIIYNQKFEGAAADLLNPNIIARDLGLKDEIKQDIEYKEKIDISTMTTEELIKRANAMHTIDKNAKS